MPLVPALLPANWFDPFQVLILSVSVPSNIDPTPAKKRVGKGQGPCMEHLSIPSKEGRGSMALQDRDAIQELYLEWMREPRRSFQSDRKCI